MKTVKSPPLRYIPPRTFGYSLWRAGHGIEVVGYEGLTILGFVECDKGNYECLTLLMNADENRLHILGGNENDLNTILFSGTDRRMAERYFYHMASRYLE